LKFAEYCKLARLILDLYCKVSLQVSRLAQLDAANSLQSTRSHQRVAKIFAEVEEAPEELIVCVTLPSPVEKL
jgi:hypothetical protein